ncbi:MAG: hypothetical protein HUK26_07100, partial [Duodenibacillus sp.]|nr:hypothetical protein [Duodenibacillus sp.]
AHALGLTHFAHTLGSQRLGWEREYSPNRYVQVSVERGWTSKRDFLGYYNPLTKAFESFDARRYDAFRLLSEECVQGIAGFPFVMLLDEANLSPMEYYWADFMNIADDRTDQAYISLGDRKQYFIPETLRFVATINNDHTTEPLSPRLLDRAGVVTLPAAEAPSGDLALRGDDPEVRHVGWPQFSALFAARENYDFNNGTLALMDALYARMAEQHPAISPRARLAVLKAVAAGGRLYREEDGRRPEVIALDYAVAQRLLPKLEGSGEAYGAWLEALAGWLEDNGLAGSGRHVRGMVARGQRRMDAFGFF